MQSSTKIDLVPKKLPGYQEALYVLKKQKRICNFAAPRRLFYPFIGMGAVFGNRAILSVNYKYVNNKTNKTIDN